MTFTIEFEETPKSRRKKLEAALTETPPQEIVSRPIHETTTPHGKIIYALPYGEYEQIDAWRPSHIVKCDTSPLAVWWERWGDKKEPTESLLWGHAVHTAALEPDLFETTVEEATGKRTPAMKQAAADRGAVLLKQGNVQFGYESAVMAAKRLLDYPHVQPFLKAGGSREVSLVAEECGLPVKCRIDWLCGMPAILDVKTTRNVDPWKFSRDFYTFHYDVKLGLYRRWAMRLLDLKELPVFCLLIGNAKPHDVTIVCRTGGEPVGIPQPVLERGADKGMRWLDRIRECVNSSYWPGIDVDPDWNLNTPNWEMDEDDDLEVLVDD